MMPQQKSMARLSRLGFGAVSFISFLFVFLFALIYFISLPINLNISVKHI